MFLFKTKAPTVMPGLDKIKEEGTKEVFKDINKIIQDTVRDVRDDLNNLQNDSRFKMGTFTRDLSLTGDVAYTGVGFAPKQIIFMGGIDNTAGAGFDGFDDGTLHYCKSIRSDGATGTFTISLPYSIIFNVNSGVSETYGIIKSMDADGFTITWSKGGAPTGTGIVYYLAFR